MAFTNLLRKLAWIRWFLRRFSHSQPIATGDFVERAAHAVNWMRVDGKLCGDGAGAALLRGGSVWTILGHSVGLTSFRNKSKKTVLPRSA